MRANGDVIIWIILGVLDDFRKGSGRMAVLIPQDTVLLIWMDRSDRKTTGDLTDWLF